MIMKGIDCAARLTAEKAKEIFNAGYCFVGRYFAPASCGSKGLEITEVREIAQSGLRILSVFEIGTGDFLGGAEAGRRNAETARECAVGVNMPEDGIIYFAIDTDTKDFDLVESYLRGAKEVLGKIGVYGSYRVIEEMAHRGAADAFWQCCAWSGGEISAHMDVYQNAAEKRVENVAVDLNICTDMDKAGLWKPEKEESMEFFGKGRFEIYVNPDGKTAAQIKAETGCTAIVNGNIYDLDTKRPCAQLKVKGRVYANENWGVNYGLCWNGDGMDVRMSADVGAWENFVGCVTLMRDGQSVQKLNCPPAMGGKRQRTAIGVTKDGRKWMYAVRTSLSPEALRETAKASGVYHAVMLDGGESVEGCFLTGNLYSSRRAHNYILFFAENASGDYCPYAVPGFNVSLWSVGDSARWVQWMLCKCGYTVTIDGVIGPKSSAAIKQFQKDHGLTADGICGKNTRNALIEAQKGK